MNFYSIYDNKSKTFDQPWHAATDTHAIRFFKANVNRVATDNMLYHYPEDYELFAVGKFDTDTGSMTGEIRKLAEAKTLRSAE